MVLVSVLADILRRYAKGLFCFSSDKHFNSFFGLLVDSNVGQMIPSRNLIRSMDITFMDKSLSEECHNKLEHGCWKSPVSRVLSNDERFKYLHYVRYPAPSLRDLRKDPVVRFKALIKVYRAD